VDREIKLIFHVGFGKTATTFIQSQFETQNNILFIGKYGQERNKRFLGAIEDLHYSLFKTYRSEAISAFSNPSRTSSKLIDKYTEELVNLILNSKSEYVVLSDECIADYGNYIGEWNLFLQIVIGNIIENRLSDLGIKVRKRISFTIREQLDVIQSLIGYSNTVNVASIDEFLLRFGSNPEEGWLGGYFYYSNIKLVEYIVDKSWDINVVPYEVLGVDGDIRRYLEGVLGADASRVVAINFENRVNSNSGISNNDGKRKSILKPRNFFSTLSFRLSQEGRLGFEEAKKRGLVFSKFFYAALFIFAKGLGFFGAVIKKLKILLRYKSIRYVSCTKTAELRIRGLYSKDNRFLAKYVDPKDLIRFGYVDEFNDF